MKKTTSLIVWGLGLNCVAAMVHSAAPEAVDPMGKMLATMPGLLVAAVGQYCLWLGLRSGLGDLWGGLTARNYREQTAGKTAQRGSGFPAEGEPLSDFDADAAFARYMEQRAAREAEPNPEPQATAPGRPAAAPAPAPRSHAQGGFGRKVV